MSKGHRRYENQSTSLASLEKEMAELLSPQTIMPILSYALSQSSRQLMHAALNILHSSNRVSRRARSTRKGCRGCEIAYQTNEKP